MTRKEHTPTPWQVCCATDDTCGRYDIDAWDTDESVTVASCHAQYEGHNSEANAKLIVRAVNSHQILIDALREMLEPGEIGLDDLLELGYLPEPQSAAKARAALALAEGETPCTPTHRQTTVSPTFPT